MRWLDVLLFALYNRNAYFEGQGASEMILYVSASFFQSPAQVLVNTVNTVGVMGKGIALEFKKLYPDMFREYQKLCEAGQLAVGKLWLYKSANKWVLNFPTKEHWRNPSRLEYIEAGLEAFKRSYARWGIHSIAFPALGCGHGRLDFETQVQPVMHRYLASLPIEVFIYPTNRDDIVAEHEQPDAMREWLRNEPRSLPFAEVWDDIKDLLEKNSAFETHTRGTPFTVHVSEEPKGIIVTPHDGSRSHIAYEAILGFWQQLRDHGFTRRSTVPGITSKQLAYLIPVFARLPFV